MNKRDITFPADVTLLIETYFRRALDNPMLAFFVGPILENSPNHLEFVSNYWISHLLEADHGKMSMRPILEVDKYLQFSLEKEHFEEWNKVWASTIDDLFTGDKATDAKNHGAYLSKFLYMKTILSRKSSPDTSEFTEAPRGEGRNLF